MSLIGHFLTGNYTVKRKAAGYYKDGFYHAGVDEETSMRGSMQPLSPREIKFVEEGDRLKQLFKFFSDGAILTDDMKKLSGADRVVINGDHFKVLSVEHWMGTSFPYFKSILAREPNQAGGKG